MERNEIISLAEEYIKLEENEKFADEVKKLLSEENFRELEDRFYKSLDFGTGGIRGIIGGGYNRMNPYIIKKVSQGLASYINKAKGEGSPSVVLAYDSRRCSRLFAETAASVFCGNGIKAYLFSSLRPTPELSFAVRKLGCTAGVVVTASHNPAEYNGYKVYWSDGGQVVPPHDTLIIKEVNSVSEIKSVPVSEAGALFSVIGKEIDDAYLEAVKNVSLRPELLRAEGKNLRIVYTPLHGAGRVPVEQALSSLGIQVITVPEQAEPDGEFPTVKFPNPEEASALALALALGKEKKASLVMGTDPDSDRLGIAVPEGDDFRLITGNQLGCMLIYYILSTLQEQGRLKENSAVIKTIVTTELQRRIGRSFGVRVYDVYTGCKYIAALIKELEKKGETCVYGGEESYGYMLNMDVRDKDGVTAAVLTSEMALYNFARGKSLLDYLNEIYEKYGYFMEAPFSLTLKGQSGADRIKEIMAEFRREKPEALGGVKVASVTDFRNGAVIEGITLDSSDVLQFVLEDESRVTVRPSGTEPKIKFYISCCEKPGVSRSEAEKRVQSRCASIRKDLEILLG